jgi:hypothetical protein
VLGELTQFVPAQIGWSDHEFVIVDLRRVAGELVGQLASLP